MACKNTLVGRGKYCQSFCHAMHFVPHTPQRVSIPVLLQAVHLGCFATEDSAAHMYDRAAICVRGPEAILNFPRLWYDNDGLPNGWVSSKAQLQSVLSKFTDNYGAATRYCVHPGFIGSCMTCC